MDEDGDEDGNVSTGFDIINDDDNSASMDLAYSKLGKDLLLAINNIKKPKHRRHLMSILTMGNRTINTI